MEEGHHFLADILTTGAILLGAALVAVLILRRLGLGAVLGYQVALCGLAMFAIIYLLLPFSWQAALVLGLPLALSSTAQVLPLLQSRGRLKTDYGEKSFAILLFQDISIVPLLTIVAALSRAPAPAGAPSGFLLAVYAVLAIVGLILAGRLRQRGADAVDRRVCGAGGFRCGCHAG